MKKMTKYIFSVVLILVVVCSALITPIKAAESDGKGINQLIDEKNKSYNEYIQQMETIMQGLVNEKELYDNSNAKDLRGSPDIVVSYDLSNAYRIYRMESQILTILDKTGSFKETFTDVVQWKIPIVTQKGDNGLVTLLEENGQLSWVATEVGEATQTWYISDTKIENAIQQSRKINGKIDSMQIAHSYAYYTTFVYLCSGKNEYLIPFSYYAKEIGINNGEVYTVSEISKKFNDCFEETKKVADDDSIIYGSGPIFKNKPTILEVTLVCSVVIGVVALIIVIRRRKKHNTDLLTK